MTEGLPMRMDKIAMALQWAIYDFMPESQRPSSGRDAIALNLGLLLASNILLPLATELALKGLHQKEAPDAEPEHTHNLSRLFQTLPV